MSVLYFLSDFKTLFMTFNCFFEESKVVINIPKLAVRSCLCLSSTYSLTNLNCLFPVLDGFFVLTDRMMGSSK